MVSSEVVVIVVTMLQPLFLSHEKYIYITCCTAGLFVVQ